MILSIIFHGSVLTLTYFTLPFLTKKPIDVPPLISVELIQISDTTNIPYAPKAAKIIDKDGKDRTAVCCLSSLNLENYDEWKKS